MPRPWQWSSPGVRRTRTRVGATTRYQRVTTTRSSPAGCCTRWQRREKNGIEVPQHSLECGLTYLDGVFEPTSGRFGYSSKGQPTSRLQDKAEDFPGTLVEFPHGRRARSTRRARREAGRGHCADGRSAVARGHSPSLERRPRHHRLLLLGVRDSGPTSLPVPREDLGRGAPRGAPRARRARWRGPRVVAGRRRLAPPGLRGGHDGDVCPGAPCGSEVTSCAVWPRDESARASRSHDPPALRMPPSHQEDMRFGFRLSKSLRSPRPPTGSSGSRTGRRCP
jgi:hypothetical protein